MLRSSTPLLTTIAAILALGVVGTTLAQEFRAGDLQIDHPWARATAPQQQNGAAYLTIIHHGSTADRVVGVQSPVAERVELHTHDVDSAGVMRMREVEAVDVPAGETTALRPGHLHVMLIGLEQRLVEGERFPLTLVFEQVGTVEVEVLVESVAHGVGAAAGQPAHGHGHSHGN
jgi:periplasmic copper chaperone A